LAGAPPEGAFWLLLSWQIPYRSIKAEKSTRTQK
jgi:hypothetical protein